MPLLLRRPPPAAPRATPRSFNMFRSQSYCLLTISVPYSPHSWPGGAGCDASPVQIWLGFIRYMWSYKTHIDGGRFMCYRLILYQAFIQTYPTMGSYYLDVALRRLRTVPQRGVAAAERRCRGRGVSLQGRGGFVYARAAAPPVRRGPLADDREPTREPRRHLDHDYEHAAACAADARRPRAPASTDCAERKGPREHVV